MAMKENNTKKTTNKDTLPSHTAKYCMQEEKPNVSYELRNPYTRVETLLCTQTMELEMSTSEPSWP